MNGPLVSVIIITKNSSTTLKQLLESIKNQTYRKLEVIVVDNASLDNTKNIAKKYTNLVFDRGPERSAQRNFGALKSQGQYLFFLDSDMVLQNNVIKECLEEFTAKKNPGGVIVPEKSFGKSFWAQTKAFEREINLGENFFEAARFFSRRVFKEFIGFDESITGPEDWDLPRRIEKKYQITRVKSFILHNEGNLKLTTLFKKKYYYGLSVNKFLKKQKDSIFSPTTMYFLRPAFYRRWRLFFKKPQIFLGMILMLTVETLGGGLGFIVGKIRK